MRKRIAMVIAVILLTCGMLFGQNISSSIVGRVADPSDAPIADARVAVKNVDTGATRITVTGADGSYVVPQILAGVYDVTISKSGFATYNESKVQVLSAQTKRVDVKLTIGAVEQTINVSGQASQVTTDSMAIGNSVSQTQLESLPTEIQTIDAFIALSPGVQTTGDATNPQIGGGTHWGSVNFNVNGVSNNDPGNSGGATVQGVGLLVMPPPSSIQELQVQANGMDARYRGKSSVSFVTKAGTNKYHFLLYEYLQNPKLNANSFLNNAKDIPRPNDRLNQFGGNIGGRIINNKLFFFFDYSGYRKRTSGTAQENYPTRAMRIGDFSALCTTFSNGICKSGTQLYNPFTGAPFLNNQIPTGMFAPQAAALLKYLPLPTDSSSRGLPSGKTNYFETIPVEQNVDGEDIRIDYNISPSDQIYGVFSQRLATPWNSFANFPSTFGQLRYGYKNFSASLTETHIVSSNTINDFRIGWVDYATKFSGLNEDVNPKDLFPQMPDTFFRGLPQINASGYGDGGVLIRDYGSGDYTPRWDWEFTDNFSHTRGKHTLQTGLDETGYKIESRKGSSTANPPTGLFSFTGTWTGNHGWNVPASQQSNGNSFADFLLGTINSDQTAWQGSFASPIYTRNWGAYFQDTWQATSSLTLILGLRWEYQTPWKYREPNTTTFDLRTGKAVLSQDSDTPVLQANMNPALFEAYQWETTGSLGMPAFYIKPDRNNFSPRLGFAWRPFGNDKTVLRGGYGVYYNFQPGFVGSRNDGQNIPWMLSTSQPFKTALPVKPTTPFLPEYTFDHPFGSNSDQVVSPNPSLSFLQWDFENARIQEWTLTLEHSFAAGWVARASYVGNHSDHLPYNSGEINIPEVQQPNVIKQLQLPYQPFSNITETRSIGIQNFNQLQIGLRRHFRSGFNLQAEYEFTRGLDNVPTSGGPQRPLHPMLDYGNSDGLRRHWLITNYIYQLPFGKGRHWLGNARGIVQAALGGWEISGITTYATGQPFNASFTVPTRYATSWFGGRADLVPGVPLYAKQSGHDVINGVSWFNPDAFAPPQPWSWGNASRNLLFGPGYTNWDISAQKSFAITEGLQLKFQADFLDAFNHFNLGNPNAAIADTRDGGLPNANTGQVFTGSGRRIIQFGLTLRY